MTIFAIGMIVVYGLCAIPLMYGLLRQQTVSEISGEYPTVSILVAARNEEQDLPACIAALERLAYPIDKLEVILVDDRSTDATSRIMQSAAARFSHFQTLSTKNSQLPLRAKALGIAVAAEQATGEWLFIADADTEVPHDWIQGLLACADQNAGILGGPFVAHPNGIAGGIEMGTTAYLMGVVFGISGLGGAPVASGPNMAIRSDLYRNAGGLQAFPPTVAEDMALLKIAGSQGHSCRGYANRSTCVRVAPVGSWRGILQQQKRWVVGGLSDAPPMIRALVVLVAIFACLGSVLTCTLWIWDPFWGLVLPIVRALFDFGIAAALAARTGVQKLYRWLPLMELHLLIGFLLVPLWVVISPKARWQEDEFDLEIGQGIR